MKIEPNKLKSFIEKTTLGGQINEMIMDFSTSGLKVLARTADNVAMVRSSLNSSVFEAYEAIGKIGLQESQTVAKLLGLFSKKVEITKTENILILKEGSKQVEVPMMDVSYISCPESYPSLDFKETFNVAAVSIKKFISDISINSDFKIILSTVEKGLMLTNTGKYKFTDNLACETATGGETSKYGDQFIKAINTMEGNLKFMMQKDSPIFVTEKSDESIVDFVVAPIVGNEDEKPKEEPKKEEEPKEE